MAMKAKNTGMIIVGGGLIKHHICNANLMVRIRSGGSGTYPNLICGIEHKMSTSSFLGHFFLPNSLEKKMSYFYSISFWDIATESHLKKIFSLRICISKKKMWKIFSTNMQLQKSNFWVLDPSLHKNCFITYILP